MPTKEPNMNDAVDPNAPVIPASPLDGTPIVNADDGETKISKQGDMFILESRKGDVSYLIRGDDEKALRAYFKASPEKCIISGG